MPPAHEELDESTEQPQLEIDSKYRLIILAAKRSKQLQRGARPRIDIDPTKHKPTRIALEEVIQGKVPFYHTTEGEHTGGLTADSDTERSSVPWQRGTLHTASGLEGDPSTDIPKRRRIKSRQTGE